MKLGLIGTFLPKLFMKPVKEYTQKVLPDLDFKAFKKKWMKEYKAMVKRAPYIGSMKENMLYMVRYFAAFGFSYYKADPESITTDIFSGLVDALCECDLMKKIYGGQSCFDKKRIEKYTKGAIRSKKQEYEGDWLFDFSYNPDKPEYFLTYYKCGICYMGKQENLAFLIPYMCKTDYPTVVYMKGKLIRTKTLGAGDDCCNFHVLPADEPGAGSEAK